MSATRYAEQRALAYAVVQAALNQRERGEPTTLADLVSAAFDGQEHIDRVTIAGFIASIAVAALEVLPPHVRALMLDQGEAHG